MFLKTSNILQNPVTRYILSKKKKSVDHSSSNDSWRNQTRLVGQLQALFVDLVADVTSSRRDADVASQVINEVDLVPLRTSTCNIVNNVANEMKTDSNAVDHESQNKHSGCIWLETVA